VRGRRPRGRARPRRRGERDKRKRREDARKRRALNTAVARASRLLRNPTMTNEQVQRRLGSIASRHKLTALSLVPDSGSDEQEAAHILGSINPVKKGPVVRKLKKHKSSFVTRSRGKYVLKPPYRNKTFTRDQCYGKSYRKPVYTWKDKQIRTPRNRGGLRHPTDLNKYFYNGQYYDNSETTIASIDHDPMVASDWNATGKHKDQSYRKGFFNAQSHLTIVPLSLNSSAGASARERYSYRVGKGFRGPKE
jgi:hypothetical protein